MGLSRKSNEKYATLAKKKAVGRQLCDSVLWRPKFLQVLLNTEGDVEAASNAAGILPMIAYLARSRDSEFGYDWDDVKRIVEERRSDAIESSVVKRAINGSPRTRYDGKGRVVEESTDHDTPAALGLLKAYQPAKFRDKQEPNAADVIKSVADLFRVAAEIRAREAPKQLPPEVIAEAIIVSARDTN